MKLSKFLILSFVFISFQSIMGCDSTYSQSINSDFFVIPNKSTLDLRMDSIITNEYYIDTNEEIKIVFALKIDSIGEIHSAHIKWSKNFNIKYSYNICNELESNFMVKFLFDEYKYRFKKNKYVFCSYLYSNIRK